MLIEIVKKDIRELIEKYYKINPLLFDNQTDVFSYPIYLKARDVLYIVLYLSKKYNVTLSIDMNNYKLICIDSIADYLSNCKKTSTT